MALFNGDFGAMATDSLFPMYPNPTSAGWACEVSVLSENGSLRGSMGEWTAVASAKRGVLGGLANDADVDVESRVETELADMVRTGVRFRAAGRFFSSKPMAGDSNVGDAAFLCRCYIERITEGRNRSSLLEQQRCTAGQSKKC
jgi:hypothetical protein